jgi:hypothetical protein
VPVRGALGGGAARFPKGSRRPRGRLGGFDGESASVETTLLTRAGQELPVDYWVVRRGDRWKVRDVIVDGASLILNYRA